MREDCFLSHLVVSATLPHFCFLPSVLLHRFNDLFLGLLVLKRQMISAVLSESKSGPQFISLTRSVPLTEMFTAWDIWTRVGKGVRI